MHLELTRMFWAGRAKVIRRMNFGVGDSLIGAAERGLAQSSVELIRL